MKSEFKDHQNHCTQVMGNIGGLHKYNTVLKGFKGGSLHLKSLKLL